MLSTGKMEMLTRLGFAARGIMYILIGFLAVRLGRNEDGAGAMAMLDGGPWRFVLALMALGFAGYGLWRLSEAWIDSEGNGSGAKGAAVRTGGAVSGLIHFGLSVYALKLALGEGGGGSGGGSVRETTASALELPGGWVALMLAAAALIGTGLFQLIKAARQDFLRHLMSDAARRPWVGWLGSGGYAARGIVFGIMGLFLFQAGRNARASEAGGMGEALNWLSGPLQTGVAAGLLLFGLFSLVEARYRRINDPKVLDRLARAAKGA